MTMRTRILLVFLLVGLVPAAVIGINTLMEGIGAIEEQAFNQLNGVREIKKGQLSQYFAERQGDMAVLVGMVERIRADASSQLLSIQALKRNAVEELFKNTTMAIKVARDNNTLINAYEKMQEEFEIEGVKQEVQPGKS